MFIILLPKRNKRAGKAKGGNQQRLSYDFSSYLHEKHVEGEASKAPAIHKLNCFDMGEDSEEMVNHTTQRVGERLFNKKNI